MAYECEWASLDARRVRHAEWSKDLPDYKSDFGGDEPTVQSDDECVVDVKSCFNAGLFTHTTGAGGIYR